MRLLLDTHVFIWLNSEPQRLSAGFRQLCQSGEHEFFLSMASPWEMQIKQQLGKLSLQVPLDELIGKNVEQNAIRLLGIDFKHICHLASLPLHHNDPFDRIILAQALTEDLTIVTADRAFSAYEASLFW